jgi:Domain of unknown function (DUF3854)
MTVAQSLSYDYRNDADRLNQESKIGATLNVVPHAESQYKGFADRSPIVEQKTFEEFKTVEERRWKESGVSESIRKANIEFLEEFEYSPSGEIIATPIHDLLGIKYVRFGAKANPPLFAAVYRNEDGSVFMLRLNQRWYDTSKKKHGKSYRFPRQSGAKVYRAAVTLADWMMIAEKQNVTVDVPVWVERSVREGLGNIVSGSPEAQELAGESSDKGFFWGWVETLDSVETGLTEGVRKVGSMLSRGQITLSLNGVTAGYRVTDDHGVRLTRPKLIPDLQKMAIAQPGQKGKAFLLVFDEEENLKTRTKVEIAQARLGRLLEAEGCQVRVALWEPLEGKGIDDAIANHDDAWLDDCLKTAPTFKQWSREQHKQRMLRLVAQLSRNSYPVEAETEGRYLPELPDLEPGAIHVIQAATGSGKSTRIAQDWKGASSGVVLAIAPLVSLGKQFAEDLDFPHVGDYNLNNPTEYDIFWTDVGVRGGVVLCPDSLHRIPDEVLNRVSLVIWDEANQVAEHITEGGTLQGKQSGVLMMISNLLRAAIANKGAIVLSEAKVYDHTIDLVKALSGGDRVRNLEHRRTDSEPWSVEILTGSTSGYFKLIQDAVVQDGKKIICPVASQSQGEKLHRLLACRAAQSGRKLSILRVDGKTNRDGQYDAFWRNANQYLKSLPSLPDILIYSPSGKSGVSITVPGFDEVWGHFTTHHPDMWMQMLARYRPSIPRKIFTTQFINAYSVDERLCSVAGVSRRLTRNTELFAKMHGVDLEAMAIAAVGEQGRVESMRLAGISLAVQNFLAVNRTAIGAQKSVSLDALKMFLKADGHIIADERTATQDTGIKEELERIQKEIWYEDAELMARLQQEDVGLNSYSKDMLLRKLSLREQFPGVSFDDVDFCYEGVFQGNGTMYRGAYLQAAIANPSKARELEEEQVKALLSSSVKLPHKLPATAVRAILLEAIGIMSLLDGKAYYNGDVRAIAIKSAALKWKDEIWSWLGLKIKESQTPVEIANKLLRKLGLEAEVIRWMGSRGEQIRMYGIKGLCDPTRMILLKAAYFKLEADISTITREIVSELLEPLPDIDTHDFIESEFKLSRNGSTLTVQAIQPFSSLESSLLTCERESKISA